MKMQRVLAGNYLQRLSLIGLICSLLLFSVPSVAAFPEGVSAREYVEILLLTSKDNAEIRIGAKSIYQADTGRMYSHEVAAEVAGAMCMGKQQLDKDTLAWLGKALAETGDGRFHKVMAFCYEKFSGAYGGAVRGVDLDERRVSYHLKKASKKLKKKSIETDGSAYEIGTADIEQMRVSLLSAVGKKLV